MKNIKFVLVFVLINTFINNIKAQDYKIEYSVTHYPNSLTESATINIFLGNTNIYRSIVSQSSGEEYQYYHGVRTIGTSRQVKYTSRTYCDSPNYNEYEETLYGCGLPALGDAFSAETQCVDIDDDYFRIGKIIYDISSLTVGECESFTLDLYEDCNFQHFFSQALEYSFTDSQTGDLIEGEIAYRIGNSYSISEFNESLDASDGPVNLRVRFTESATVLPVYSNYFQIDVLGCSIDLIENNPIQTTDATCYSAFTDNPEDDTNDGSVTVTFDGNVDQADLYRMRYYVFEGDPQDYMDNDVDFERAEGYPENLFPQVVTDILFNDESGNGFLTDDDNDGNFSGTLTGLSGNGTDTFGNPRNYNDYFIIYQEIKEVAGVVTVKSGNITPAFTIRQPSELKISIDEDNEFIQLQCFDADAQVTVTASGGGYDGADADSYQYRYKQVNQEFGDWQSSPTFIIENEDLQIGNNNFIFQVGQEGNDQCFSADSEVVTIVVPEQLELSFIPENSNLTTISGTTNGVIGFEYSGGSFDGDVPDSAFGITYSDGSPVTGFSINHDNNGINNDIQFLGLGEGSYIITFSQSNTCFVTSDTIAIEPIPTPEFGSVIIDSQVSCTGLADAQISVPVTYGANNNIAATIFYRLVEVLEDSSEVTIADDQIDLDDDNTTNEAITLADLGPGSYKIYAISELGDFNDQNQRDDVLFTLDAAPAIAVDFDASISTNVNCNGDADGSIVLSVSGATSYEYTLELVPDETDWITLPTNNTISGLTGQTYNLTLRNAANTDCQSEIYNNAFIIGTPEELEVAEVLASHVNVSTFGGNDGVIEVEVTGGADTEAYTYTWTAELVDDQQTFVGASTPIITDLYAGAYSLTVSDVNGCSVEDFTIGISEPAELNIVDLFTTTNSCFGEDSGSITAQVEGTGELTLTLVNTLDDSETIITTDERTVVFSDLAQGSYTLNLLEVETNEVIIGDITAVIDITEEIVPTIETTPSCIENGTGSINITAVTGGTLNTTPVYTYKIDDENPVFVGTFNDLEAGDYLITIIENGGCTHSETVTVETAKQIVLNTTESVINNISDEDFSDGSILPVFNYEDGTEGNFTYSWIGPNVGGSTDKDITNLVAGEYTVIVTDDIGCSLEETFTIIVQDEFSIQPLTGTPTLCFDQNNGSITATLEATGLVTYTWRLEDGTAISTILDSDLREITLDNLEDGSYYLEATNENNTTITSDIFTIVRLQEITATILTTRTCFEGNTGTITFIDPVGSPSGSFLYSIDNGVTYQDTPLFEGLPEGTYYPRLSTVENSNCDFITNAVDILASPALFYDEAGTTITRASGPGANDGSISVAVQGGTPPYTYVIDGGTPQDTNVFNNLSEGTYEITITDSVGCMEPAIIEVTAIGPLTISNIVPNDALCRNEANGSITATVTGEGDIIYSWTLPDGSPVPVSNGVNTQNLEGILAGDYVLTVTDDITTVTSEVISVGEPTTSLTILEITSTDVSCFGGSDGSIEIQADGGTGNYNYSINGVDFQPELIFDGLEANNYTVTVRDENLCEFQEPTPVAIIAPLSLNITVIEQIPTSAANASGGAIYIAPEGGSDSYTYLWSGPNGFTSNEQDITNLEAGTYSVIITDANFNSNNDAGCQFISEDIIVTEPGQLVATIEQTEFIACSGDASAEIVANVQGGVLPYTYQWYEDDNGNNILLEEESDIINNLANGTYYLIATDDNDISIESNRIVITQPSLLEITVDNVTNVLCSGESTGAISVTVSGGTPPYQYYWSNGETLPDITGLEAGEYTIEVEDNEGCIAEQSIVIASPNEAIEITESILTNASDYQVNDGSIAIEVAGGQEPYTYTWIQSSTDAVISNEATISNLSADTYTVIISDVYDCDVTEIYEITQPDIIEETILQPSCFGNTDGSINLLVNKGNGVFTYQWSSGEATNTLNNLGAGTYTVTVTGLSDGPITRTYILENPNPINVNLGIDRVLCADQTLELD
ncbi:SprB repeat-containing protein, partial [Maribacter sp.]|uniref:SprB repeat-containing protein n=1 Tax=Maribacter sp. TaxID=1897614 RepID=UPI003298A4DD